MQTRFTRLLAATVLLGGLLVAVLLAVAWAADRLPLWFSAPALVALVLIITWRETRA